jgi:GT2 family glycosyltransferase
MGSTLIHKSVFDNVGSFDTELKLAEDSDWFFRVMEAGIRVHVMQDTVQLYRQHSNNITKDKVRTNSFMLKAFKKSLDRRRKSGILTDLPLPAFGNIDQVKQFWLKNKQ